LTNQVGLYQGTAEQGCGKKSALIALCQGTTFSRADKQFICDSRAGFSPREICYSDFFSSLWGHALYQGDQEYGYYARFGFFWHFSQIP
jgi:hypothetical protein